MARKPGEDAAARAAIEEAHLIARELNDPRAIGFAMTRRALLHERDGDPAAAEAEFRGA